MKKVISATIALLLLASLLAGCGGKPAGATELTVDGITFTLDQLTEGSNVTPADMPAGYECVAVKLAYTGDGDAEACRGKLYDEGYLLAPDGEQYKAGSALSIDGDGDRFYSLLVGVPKGTNAKKLVLVYGDQQLGLS